MGATCCARIVDRPMRQIMTEKRGNEVFGGAFIIGMAILFLTGWWWPGILYVTGVAMVARTVAQGRNWMDERSGLVLLVVAVVFTLIGFVTNIVFNWWPLILIAVGLYLLYNSKRGGNGGNGDSDSAVKEKPKNDDFV
jgi:membrane-associated phospholipid phosphatase